MPESSVALDHAAIAARIPHQGAMCLLDSVLHWDDSHITCRAHSHRDAGNPLRSGSLGALGSANGIEYAAQAMAVHGALLAGMDAAPAAGYLASVREVRWQCARLDDIADDLLIHVQRLSGDALTVMYQFRIEAGRGGVVAHHTASASVRMRG